MRISSNAFSNGGALPTECTRRGGDEKPSLLIEEVPPNAKSLVLVMKDMDSPGGAKVHWIVWNIPPNSREVRGIEGTNGFGEAGYSGPMLGKDDGIHKYMIKLYAISRDNIPLLSSSTFDQLDTEISGCIIDEASLMCRSGREADKVVDKRHHDFSSWGNRKGKGGAKGSGFW